MDWERVRAHYARRFEASQSTQQDVAAAGQLPGQSAIQKLIANRKRGPSVETFLKAVLGLGITVSTFFAELEAPPPTPITEPSSQPPFDPSSILDRLRDLERALAAMAPPVAQGRVHELSAPLSGPGTVVHITTTTLDERFERMVGAHFETLRVQLERSADRLAEHLDTCRGVDSHAPPARAPHRRRTRKTA